jgi:hypothetical protein
LGLKIDKQLIRFKLVFIFFEGFIPADIDIVVADLLDLRQKFKVFIVVPFATLILRDVGERLVYFEIIAVHLLSDYYALFAVNQASLRRHFFSTVYFTIAQAHQLFSDTITPTFTLCPLLWISIPAGQENTLFGFEFRGILRFIFILGFLSVDFLKGCYGGRIRHTLVGECFIVGSLNANPRACKSLNLGQLVGLSRALRILVCKSYFMT